jgi:hypothetical protein
MLAGTSTVLEDVIEHQKRQTEVAMLARFSQFSILHGNLRPGSFYM